MSVIPARFACDKENCDRSASFDEALNRQWYIVVFSSSPRYVAINAWASSDKIPSSLKKWHACGWDHALELQANAGLNL